MTVSCPTCKSEVVWKYVLNNDADYYCPPCRETWKAAFPVTNFTFGKMIGYWTDVEKFKLEKHLSSKRHDLFYDWIFFKGRQIWSAWPKRDNDKVIYVKTLDELLYWSSMRTSNPNWFMAFQRQNKLESLGS